MPRPDITAAARAMGRKGGAAKRPAKGGWIGLTPEQRSQRAREAAQARWAKVKEAKETLAESWSLLAAVKRLLGVLAADHAGTLTDAELQAAVQAALDAVEAVEGR